MNVSEQIRQKIDAVASERLSVWAFEQWLEPVSWSMHRDLPSADIQLIGALQALFARFDYEGADESALRSELLHEFERSCPSEHLGMWRVVSGNIPVKVSLSF